MLASKEDDLNHEPQADPLWRESYFFNFYDPDSGVGMYTSMGERPFKDRAGSILTIWGDKGTYANNYIFDSVHRAERRHRTQGLVYECIEPLEKWRITYSGTLFSYPEPGLRVDPSELTREASAARPQQRIEMDVTWEGICPAHAYAPNPGMFDMHLEQHGRVRGWIRIGDEEIEVDGIGIRDRSCGQRNWGSDKGWTWIPTFIRNPELPLVVAARARHRDGETEEVGYFYDKNKGRLERVIEFKEEIERRDAAHIGVPVGCRFDIRGEKGTSMTLRGKVIKVVPTVMLFKKPPGEAAGETCWIDRCLVEYDMGSGISEYGEVELGNMIEGRPEL